MKLVNLKADRQRKYCINSRLRRARRMYVYFMRHRINAYRNDVLDFMEERMHERGLYAEKTDARSVRQSIISYLYKIETGNKGYSTANYKDISWWGWLMRQSWDIGKGYSKPIMKKQA